VRKPKIRTRATGVVLDSGAFIALEKGDPVMVHLSHRFIGNATSLVTSAGVVAEVWRGGGGAQFPIAYLLRKTEVVDLTYPMARVLGRILGATRSRDPIDAHVVLLARQRGWPVLSSDPEDLRAIDPEIRVEKV
jgi:hypothetical protein